MALHDYTARILSLSAAIKSWRAALAELRGKRRERIADYCESIAATLARAAEAYQRLEQRPNDIRAERTALREFGRLTGYVDDIAGLLEDHLDGRKLAGVKRRLEHLVDETNMVPSLRQADAVRIGRLVEAEGYFRALADGLRA